MPRPVHRTILGTSLPKRKHVQGRDRERERERERKKKDARTGSREYSKWNTPSVAQLSRPVYLTLDLRKGEILMIGSPLKRNDAQTRSMEHSKLSAPDVAQLSRPVYRVHISNHRIWIERTRRSAIATSSLPSCGTPQK